MAETPMIIKDLTLGTDTATAYTFPSADGAASEVLQTDGAGVLSFAAAGGGLPTGTVTGTILKWNGATWVETTSATGQILVSAENEITINDGAATAANIVLLANDGGPNDAPKITLTNDNSGAQLILGDLHGSGGFGISCDEGFGIYGDTGSSIVGIGNSNRGGLLFPNAQGQITQRADLNLTLGADYYGTSPKNWLKQQDVPAYYQEYTVNTEARWAFWCGEPTYAIAVTADSVADAVYINLGEETPDQQDIYDSWPFYRFDVYYINVTDGTNEYMTIHLLHDGTTRVSNDTNRLRTTAAQEMEYVTRYDSGNLELGLWSGTTGKSVKFYIRAVAGGGMA